MAYSPDERLIVTGTSANRGGEGGALVFFDSSSRQMVRRVGMPASVVAVQWHARLNQIFLGVGEHQPVLKLVLVTLEEELCSSHHDLLHAERCWAPPVGVKRVLC